MKVHSANFKNEIRLFGRELDSKIIYTINNEEIELGKKELNSITPHYEGSILKSVMKQLDIDSNVEIPVGTIVNYQFGVKVNGSYEYVDFGNYEVYKVEKNEDTNSWKIICYDKMLKTMTPYVNIGIEYPITVRNYIIRLCEYLNINFEDSENQFANYNRMINQELFLSEDGSSLEYTFRDVFDQLSEVTASTICINSDDKLEIRYINDTHDTINAEYLKDINVKFGEKYGVVNSIVLSRTSESDSVYLRDEESVQLNGLCEIKIKDNQIMNFNDRADYLPDILEKLDGLEYYLNDFSSTGIVYYDLCDSYNIQIDNKTYKCIMFNDEVNITQGLVENIHTEALEQSETDYSKADKDDRKINQAYFIVNKQKQTIEGLVSKTEDNISRLDSIEANINGITNTLATTGGTNLLKDSMGVLNDGSWVYANGEKANIISTNYKEAVGFSAIVLGTELMKQKIKCKNGLYNVSFKFDKQVTLGTMTIKINDNSYVIDASGEYEEELEITTNEMEISIVGSNDNVGYIYDFMVNAGSTKKQWEQNQDETTTDTVKIGKGIEVSSSSQNTISRMDADGFRVISNQTNEEVLYATDKGTVTNEFTSKSKSDVNGVLFIKVGNQTWLTGVDNL